jgi:hypothetical protein
MDFRFPLFSRNCAADFLGPPRFESVREKPALA